MVRRIMEECQRPPGKGLGDRRVNLLGSVMSKLTSQESGACGEEVEEQCGRLGGTNGHPPSGERWGAGIQRPGLRQGLPLVLGVGWPPVSRREAAVKAWSSSYNGRGQEGTGRRPSQELHHKAWDSGADHLGKNWITRVYPGKDPTVPALEVIWLESLSLFSKWGEWE